MTLNEQDQDFLLETVEARRRHENVPDAPGVVSMLFELFGLLDFGAERLVIVSVDCRRRDLLLIPMARIVLESLGHKMREYAPCQYRVGEVRLEFITAREAGLNARKRVTVGRYRQATVALDPLLDRPGADPVPSFVPAPPRRAPRIPQTTQSK